LACLVLGALGGQAALPVGSPPRRAVEQVGHGPARRGRGGRGSVAAEPTQQLHSHPRRLTPRHPGQEPVLLGDRQAGHPCGQVIRIVGGLLQRWRSVRRDREQVVVEAQEVGQRPPR
jgi:hypothetical protein